MDNNNKLSLIELYKESIECEIMLNDFMSLDEDAKSILSIPLIPSLAFICQGIQAFIGEANDKQINGKNVADIINKTRIKTKFYSDKSIKKTLDFNTILMDNILYDLTHKYNIIQKSYIRVFGQEMLGVYKYQNKYFFNNLQGYEYLSEILSEGQFTNSFQKAYLEGEYAMEFAKELSGYIVYFNRIIENYLEIIDNSNIEYDSSEKINTNDISYKDYYLLPEKKQFFFITDLPIQFSLTLFNLLCALQFSNYILPKLFRKNSKFVIRIRIVTYISIVLSLKKISNQEILNNYSELKEKINKIVLTKENIISYSIRNNLFHFGIISNSSEEDHIVDFRDIIVASSGIEFKEFMRLINKETIYIIDTLQTILFS